MIVRLAKTAGAETSTAQFFENHSTISGDITPNSHLDLTDSDATQPHFAFSPITTIADSLRSRGCTIGGSSYVIQQRTFHLRATHVMVSSEITWAAMVRRPMCFA